MAGIIEIIRLINIYPLVSVGSRDCFGLNIEVILDPGLIFVFCNHCSFVSQVIRVKDKLNWLTIVILFNVQYSSISNIQKIKSLFIQTIKYTIMLFFKIFNLIRDPCSW